MKRLTEKRVIKPSCTKDGELEIREYIHIEDKNLAEKKLYDLEDIEEELGIDLITLFKALKNGIWFIYNPNQIYYHELPSIDYHKQLDRWYIRIDYDVAYKIKDYGKTWALTKEELL